MSLESNWACPGGCKLEHKNDQLQNSFCLKLEGVELWYLVVSISEWTSIQFVHRISWGSKLASLQGHKLEYWNKEDQLQNYFSLKFDFKLIWAQHAQGELLGCCCVRRRFCVFFFKHLLLPNRWASLDQTWQECSLGDPLQKLWLLWQQNEIFKQFFKNVLVWKCWSGFEMIWQECSLGDLFQKLFTKFLSVQKHGSGECWLFALYGHEEIRKKSSSLKPSVRF